MEEAEAALAALEDELADPAAWATKYESAKSEARHTAAKRAVEAAYAALEEHVARFHIAFTPQLSAGLLAGLRPQGP